MEWMSLIGIIVTVLSIILGVIAIVLEKIKSRKKKEELKLFLRDKNIMPMINWAKKKEIDADFHELLERLVGDFDVSSGYMQQIGFDIITDSSIAVDFVPKGVSVWKVFTSFPTRKSIIDTLKSIEGNEDVFNTSDTTCIIVTPHLIEEKETIKRIVNKEFVNKIIIYDVIDISNWLRGKSIVSTWFNIKYLGETAGIVIGEQFWEEWITGPKFKLDASILIGGRDNEKTKLLNDVNSSSSIITVQSSSREESLAFSLACFIDNSSLQKCFIVDNPESFKDLVEKNIDLILIPRFENLEVINMATKNGHSVIVPIGNDDTNTWNSKIELPPIGRDEFVQSLISVGCKEEEAKRMSIESAKNITILRRQLGFSRTLPKWANPEYVRDILPALLVGRWADDLPKDRELLSKLAGVSYEEYISKLSKWLFTADSPIIKIGRLWRIASPLDAWTNISQYILSDDLKNLKELFLEVFSVKDNSLEHTAKERLFIQKDSKDVYSSWIKEGLAQSLILVAVYCDRLKIALTESSQSWVDVIIIKLLETNDVLLWKTFERYLPSFAEASPIGFLNSMENHLVKKSVIGGLFEEEDGLIMPSSYHTSLLWALESLAWMPENLSRTSLVLAKLSELDPGGRLANRPLNSLIEIFKPWHFQTFSKFEERMDVLKLIAKEVPAVAWDLLCRLLPEGSSAGQPTSKMRWRLFDKSLNKSILYQEIWDTHSTIVEILISLFDDSEEKLAVLIRKSSVNSISPNDRDILLNFLESRLDKVIQNNFTAWHELRGILSHHRSYPDAGWSLSEDILLKYQDFYEKLSSKDIINNTIWLFNEDYPKFPEGNNNSKLSFEEIKKLILEKRIEAIKVLISKFGIDKVIDLSFEVKCPWVYGNVLAYVTEDGDDLSMIFEQLKLDKDKLNFVHAYIYKKSQSLGIDWVFSIYTKLLLQSYDVKTLGNIFLPIEQNSIVWERIKNLGSELDDYYWNNIRPYFYDLLMEEVEFGIHKLLEVKRFHSALHVCHDFSEIISSSLIAKVLNIAAIEKASESIQIDIYGIESLFEELDEKGELPREEFIKLEFLYLSVLASMGGIRKPKHIHEELSKNPSFFIDVIKFLYKSKDETINDKESEERLARNEESRQNIEGNIYILLHEWKIIPGVDKEGVIDNQFLNDWIEESRNLAKACGRKDIVDMYIGQLLAQYPENEKDGAIWPPEEICQIIEDINTESIKNNFSCALYNKRGSSSRGVFDGGDIEGRHAEYFEKLAAKQRNKYPNVAAVFSRLAVGYREDERNRDLEAEKIRLEY